MKKFTLLFGLSLIFTLTNAQNLKYLKVDTIGIVPDFHGVRPFILENDLLNDPRKYIPDNRPDLPTMGNIRQIQPDGMPVIIPYGNFRMRIYKPDSSVRYSLVIKRIPVTRHTNLKR